MASFLSKEDIDILKQIARERRANGGGIKKPTREDFDPAEKIGQVNDTYVALVPTGGIDAVADSTGTGGGEEPGSAVCDIYKISRDGILISTGLSRKIWNTTSNALGEGDWIPVSRDKFGSWLAMAGGGAGEHVLFRITAADTDCCVSVTATVVGGPCSGNPVTGDSITVYDEAGCFFNVPAIELINLYGFAQKLKFPDGTTGTGTATGGTEANPCDTYTGTATSSMLAPCPDKPQCRWVVYSLCCYA